jgi:hypothetical protein
MQGLGDTGAILSIGDYVLSLGAHGMHACLLMDDGKNAPLTVERTFEIAALLSYVFRCPIVPRHWTSLKKEQLAVNRRGFEKNLRGFSLDEYTEALTTVAVMTEDLFLRGSRPGLSLDRFPEFDPRRWYLLSPPTRSETWRAVTSYWTALMSITLPGRILNFYRAFEAVVGAQQGALQLREGLFSQVPTTSVRPVYAIARDIRGEKRPRLLDLNGDLRLRARRRYAFLLKVHKSSNAVIAHLAREGRGKAAHADVVSLEYDRLHELADQALDAALLEYVARIAIDAQW